MLDCKATREQMIMTFPPDTTSQSPHAQPPQALAPIQAAPPPPPPSPPPQKPEESDVVQRIKRVVELYFRVYDVKVLQGAAAFFCMTDKETVEEKFRDLREALGKIEYTPMMRYEGGEHIIYVFNKPQVRGRSTLLNVALLFATVLTTVLAGAQMYMGYDGAAPTTDNLFSAHYLGYGLLFFTLPVMFILGVHEMSHYYMAKKHGVKASLPYFIPAPGMLGTFGAFINIREPIPSRKALFDIGAAGPIASFFASVPVIMIGLYFMSTSPHFLSDVGGTVVYLGRQIPPLNQIPPFDQMTYPIFFFILSYFVPISPGAAMHPTAFAGWVGLLVTAMNLLPAGQLDGGHIARALWGDDAKYASYAAIILMIALGFVYMGWFMFAILIMLLGMAHPPPLDDISRLGNKRTYVALFVGLMLVLTFVPIPMEEETLAHADYSIGLDAIGGAAALDVGSSANYTLLINNTGNVKSVIRLNASGRIIYAPGGTPQNITPGGGVSLALVHNGTGIDNITLGAGESDNLTLEICVAGNASYYGCTVFVNVTATPDMSPSKRKNVLIETAVRNVALSASENAQNISFGSMVNRTGWAVYNISIKNIGSVSDTFSVSLAGLAAARNHTMNETWAASISTLQSVISGSGAANLSVALAANQSAYIYANVSITLSQNTTILPKEGVVLNITAASQSYPNSLDAILLSAALRN